MKVKHSGMAGWTLCFCLALSVACPVGAQVGPQYATNTEPPRIIAGPYLQSPAEDSMTVIWMTDKNATAWVEYGAGESLDHKAVATHDGLVDANTRLHKVRLTGLTPGTQYRYRVGSTEIVKFGPYSVTFGARVSSPPTTFNTLNRQADKVSVVVMNDLHQRGETLQALWALAEAKTVDLVFFNGDSMDYLESEEQVVAQLLQPVTELFATTTPLMFVRGNHETRGRFARFLHDYLDSPGGRYYYSFDAGPIHFVVLDSGEDKDDSHPAYSGLADFAAYRDEERLWLAKEVQSETFREARFRVVLMHMPPFSTREGRSLSGGRADCYEKFAPLLNEVNVDLMITAHTHRHAYLEPRPDQHDYPVVNGAGPQLDSATLIRLDADQELMHLTVTRADGEVLQRREYPVR